MLLNGLRVVLVNTRFPENIGMAARACANMGCSRLVLVTPERWIYEKAAPLATPKGLPVLGDIVVCSSLAEAVADCHLIFATTARTGGWRRALQSPQEAGSAIATGLEGGQQVALVFGSEDRGLENTDIELCQHIVTIPTSGEASSLNLAQSVLLLLWECAKARRGEGNVSRRPTENVCDPAPGQMITSSDMERLMDTLAVSLTRLDVLHGKNPEYFLMTWRRMFARARLRRHEYDALMGVCRQVMNFIPNKKID